MATRNESESRRRAIERNAEEESKRQEAVNKFGSELGEAFFEYAHGYSDEKKTAFAEVIITTFETGTHDEKVKSVEALLSAVEERIRPAARNAARANAHFLRF